jgi:hypothetical protein
MSSIFIPSSRSFSELQKKPKTLYYLSIRPNQTSLVPLDSGLLGPPASNDEAAFAAAWFIPHNSSFIIPPRPPFSLHSFREVAIFDHSTGLWSGFFVPTALTPCRTPF